MRSTTPRDFEYVRDLGHVAPYAPLRIANPVYAEVLSRELTWVLEHEMSQQTAWYVDPHGSLNLDKLLAVHQPRVTGQVLPHRTRTRQGFELARHADDGAKVSLGRWPRSRRSRAPATGRRALGPSSYGRSWLCGPWRLGYLRVRSRGPMLGKSRNYSGIMSREKERDDEVE